MTDEQIINIIKNAQKKSGFWMKTFFNYHLTLYRDWQDFGLKAHFSIEDSDEHNCLIHLWFLFFGLEFSWNGAKLWRKLKASIPHDCRKYQKKINPEKNQGFDSYCTRCGCP